MQPSVTCQVCGRSGDCSPLHSRPSSVNPSQPFFPFLAALATPSLPSRSVLHPLAEDLRLGCRLCVSFLLNQWADFERRAVPLPERSYYVKTQTLRLGAGAQPAHQALHGSRSFPAKPMQGLKLFTAGETLAGRAEELEQCSETPRNICLGEDQRTDADSGGSENRDEVCAACRASLTDFNRVLMQTRLCDLEVLARLCNRPVSSLEPRLQLCTVCYGKLMTSCSGSSGSSSQAEPRRPLASSAGPSSALASILFSSHPSPSGARPASDSLALLPNFTRMIASRQPSVLRNELDVSEARCGARDDSFLQHRGDFSASCSPLSPNSEEHQVSSTAELSRDGPPQRPSSPQAPTTVAEARLRSSQPEINPHLSLSGSHAFGHTGGAGKADGFSRHGVPHHHLPVKKKWRNFTHSSDAELSEEEPSSSTPRPQLSVLSPLASHVTSTDDVALDHGMSSSTQALSNSAGILLASSTVHCSTIQSPTLQSPISRVQSPMQSRAGSRVGSRAPSPDGPRHSLLTLVQVSEAGMFGRLCRPLPLTRPGSPPAAANPVLVLTEPSAPDASADDVTQDAPIVCYVCGAFEFRACELFAQPCSEGDVEVNGLHNPFFPCLRQMQCKGADPMSADGKVSVCQICFHILMAQWNEFEISSNEKHVDRWNRRYDASRMPCYVCGTIFRRRRAAVLRVTDFPFLRYHSRPTGSVALRRGRECVVCRACASSLRAQLQQYKKMGLPPHLRQYNWNSKRERHLPGPSSESELSDDTDMTESTAEQPQSRHPIVTPVGVSRVVRRRKRPRHPSAGRDVSDEDTTEPRKRVKRPASRTAAAAQSRDSQLGAVCNQQRSVDDSSCCAPDSDSQRDDTDVASLALQRTPRRRKPRQQQRPWLGPNPLSWGSFHRDKLSCPSQSEEDIATLGLTCLAAAAQVHSSAVPPVTSRNTDTNAA